MKIGDECIPALETYAEGNVDSLMAGIEKAREAIVARDEEEFVDFLKDRAAISKKRAGCWIGSRLKISNPPTERPGGALPSTVGKPIMKSIFRETLNADVGKNQHKTQG